MSYGPDDSLRDLLRIWGATASGDDQTSLDFFLLAILQDEGPKGVAALIRGFDQSSLGKIEITETETEVAIRLTRSGLDPLVVTAFADGDLAWVDVRTESRAAPAAVEDPRHAAFYSIWERLQESEADGAESRSVEENAVYLMALLESQVMNGGIGQYLTNTEGLHLPETFECLEKIGATTMHALLTTAVQLASGLDSYVDAWDEKSESYSRLDAEFLESGEDLARLTADAFLR